MRQHNNDIISAWSAGGVMGRNRMLNMADHGFSVAGMTRTREVRQRIVVSTNGFPAVIGNVVIDASVLEQLSEVGIRAIG